MNVEQNPSFDYETPAVYLRQLLEWLEEHIDSAYVAAVHQRHVASLLCLPVDRPPIILAAPVAEPFRVYPYAEVFEDATKMMVNELVGPYAVLGPTQSVVNSILNRDDYPLQIRANYGTGTFASLFGAHSEVHGDNFPWVRPLGLEAVQRIVDHGVPDVGGGLCQRCLDTMVYYQEVLAAYPKCRQAIHITQPDLQGPFSVAEQIWGGDIFTAFYDHPELMRQFLDVLTETWIAANRRFSAASTQVVQEGFICLHFTMSRGGGLVKDDTSVMLSPATYVEYVRPANEKVLQAMGGGGIHWCGTGDQWRSQVLETQGLMCLDWGQPQMIDLASWAPLLREQRLPVSQMCWQAEDFLAADPMAKFPTGATMSVYVEDENQLLAVRRLVQERTQWD